MKIKVALISLFSLSLLLVFTSSECFFGSTPPDKEKPQYTIEAGVSQQFEWLDDNHFATISQDASTINIHSIASNDKTPLRTFDWLVRKGIDDKSPSYQMSVSKDGKRLAAIYESGNVRIWDVNTGQVSELWGSNLPDQKEVFFVDDNGEEIIVQSKDQVKRFHFYSSGAKEVILKEKTLPSCTAWRGKKGLKVGEKQVTIHTLPEKQDALNLTADFDCGTISPDEQTVALWSVNGSNPCHATPVYDLIKKAMINRIEHSYGINRIRFTQGSQSVIVSGGKEVSIWSATDRGSKAENLLKTIELDHQVVDAAGNPSSSLIAVIDRYGKITCWSPEPFAPSTEDRE